MALTELRKSEEKYRLLVDTINEGLWSMNADHVTSYVNQAMANMLGYTIEEILGRKVEEFFFEEDMAFHAERMRKRHAGEDERYARRFRRKNGSSLWTLVSAKTLKDESGHFLGSFAVFTDITERKLAEETLRASEERYRNLLTNLELGIVVHAADTSIHVSNPKASELLGLSEGQMKGKVALDPQWKFVDQNNIALPLEEYPVNRILSSKRPIRNQILGVYRPVTNDTIWLEVNGFPVFDDNGLLLEMPISFFDITERKQAEKDLRYSYELMSYIIKHNTSALAVHDKDFNYLFVSERYLQDYKVKEKNIIGKHHYDVFPDLPQKWRDVHQKALSGITSSAENDRYDREDGSVEWTTWECRPWYQGNGEIGGFVVYTEVVTDKIKAEEQKLLLQKQLSQAQKMEAIGVLAGGIAHDFNNILGAILGYSEMVQDDCPIGSRMRNDIDRVVEASHRAKELVKQILAFSRQTETEAKPLQPSLIIKEAVKMLRPSFPSTIDIQQNIDPDVGLILGDPTQIHQILTNLCTNAFHAMEETGGILTISLKNKELHLSDLVSEPDVQPGLFVDISVGDTGPGISPQIVDKIFDPFFTTKEVGRGTGMGLAIIHGIAKKSGGVVSFQSSPGEGTIFHVYMPVFISTSTLVDEIPPIELIQPGIERILFIDDEKMLAEMGKTMLERLGYRVTMATSSIEALKTIQNQPDNFDLVITDQTMPDMTGIDLARRILQIRPGLPIILCTGFSNLISEEKARMYGIKGFAMKPLAKKDLAALIRTVLDEEKRYT